MHNRWVVTLTAAAMLAAHTGAKGQATFVGGVELTLGMAKPEAMARLTKNFKLDEFGDGAWTVLALDLSGSGWHLLGVVAFNNGRLTRISRRWEGKSDAGSLEFARGLFGALRELGERGDRTCLVRTNESEQPGGSVKEAFLECPSRTVQISIVGAEGAERAMVDEVLALPEVQNSPGARSAPGRNNE